MRINLRTALAIAGVLVAAGFGWRVVRQPAATASATHAYTDSRQCKVCHSRIYLSYQQVGMGRSFAEVSRAASLEDYERKNTLIHAASGRHYQMFRRGDRVFQRRYELDSHGSEINVFEQEATHAIGSGNHARTYLHRSESGELTELPVTWYSQENRWDMSPGFEGASPPDFTRIVDDRCLFCHNAYPGADGKLAEGIDCQRCHGPGADHVQLASSGKASARETTGAIVNPAKLSPERLMDVCMQCHLETTSMELPSMIRRFERDVYSFRAGESLGGYNVHFDEAPGTGRAEKFEIVNQAYRLRQSACFLKSSGRLTCITCHNPHSVEHGAAAAPKYRAVCMECHRRVNTTKHPDLQSADCVSCHMPRRLTEDVPHVRMTDHLIGRKPVHSETPKHPRGQPVVYYPEGLSSADHDLYLGVALLTAQADRHRGMELLERTGPSGAPAKALAVLGEGYLAEGNAQRAVEMFRLALAKPPALPKAQYNLGQALEKAGNLQEAASQYERAIQMQPPFPEAEYALANLLVKTRGDAETHYRNAIRARPAYPEALNNLGNLYAEKGDLEKARAQFGQALTIDPGFAEAHNNLGRALAAQHLTTQALAHMRRAVRLKPDYAEARYNLAQLLQVTDDPKGALTAYRQAITTQPDFVEAHLGLARALADAGSLDAAIVEFREVLRLRPDHVYARRDLDAALAIKGGGSR